MFDKFDIVKKVDENGESYLELHIADGVEAVPCMGWVLQSCGYNNLTVRKVVLPESVKKIGNFAFENFCSLNEINLPSGLERIGGSAFCGCENLKHIDFPETLTSIEVSAFYNSGLHSIEIPDSVSFLGDSAFANCAQLKNVKLPKTLPILPSYCFRNCVNLEDVKMPAKLNRINVAAFKHCEKLSGLDIPNETKEIAAMCFTGCVSLREIQLPESVKYIGEECFLECSNLEKVNIPKSFKVIRARTFADCLNLQTINGLECVRFIDSYALRNCKSLGNIAFNEGLLHIGNRSFDGCSSIEQIDLPSTLEEIGHAAFDNCENLNKINIRKPHTKLNLNNMNGLDCCLSEYFYYYFDKDTGDLTITNHEDKELASHCFLTKCRSVGEGDYNINDNYRQNFVKASKFRDMHITRYIPQQYILEMFPSDIFENYFKNKNDLHYGQLVRTLGLDKIRDKSDKRDALTGLFKIYYALGGFSENPLEARKAYDYILDGVAPVEKGSDEIGEELHGMFSGFQIDRSFSPTFAQFFMKYYKDNHCFMFFDIDNGGYHSTEDYLWRAHNNWYNIIKAFPNRVVNTNERRACLTPRFVAEHCEQVVYDYVNLGNEALAGLVGKYCYSQSQFENMQEVYDRAKELKDNFVICADKAKEDECITYRILAKDDPLGFVLGDITNCCQRYGSDAESCVIDGYTNPNAGFLVFEERVKDENGNLTDEKRIVSQAYVYYDPVTKTVCYDNIEIPTVILNKLKSNKGNNIINGVTYSDLGVAVKSSAEAIMNAMNNSGVPVERVTIGAGCNDLNGYLSQKYKTIQGKNLAVHRGYYGYSDSKAIQYEIRNINNVSTIESVDLQI